MVEVSLRLKLHEMLDQILEAVLADCRGNISEAARRLGLHRRT